jgi:type I restriction enzyme, S subunit
VSDWPEVTLGDAMSLDLKTVDVEPDATYDIVGVLNRGRGLLRREPMPGTDTAYKNLNVIRPRQVVYSRLKAFEGAITVVSDDAPESFASQEFPTFTCGSDLLPEYFALHTTTAALWARLQGLSTGMGGRRERVKPADFLTIRVPLPPLAEQRRIVDLVASIDAQVAALTAEETSFASLRSRLTHNAEDASVIHVGDVAEVSTGRSLPKAVQGRQSGEISWFKIADMTGEPNVEGYTRAQTRLTMEEVQGLGGVVIPAGAVVFPRVGAAVLTEKKRIMEVAGAVDENHLVLIAKPGVSSEYLLACMEALKLSDLVQTGAVPSLNMTLMRNAPLPWSRSENTQLHNALRDARALQRSIRAERERLTVLRAALASSLLERRVEITGAYDRLLGKVA